VDTPLPSRDQTRVEAQLSVQYNHLRRLSRYQAHRLRPAAAEAVHAALDALGSQTTAPGLVTFRFNRTAARERRRRAAEGRITRDADVEPLQVEADGGIGTGGVDDDAAYVGEEQPPAPRVEYGSEAPLPGSEEAGELPSFDQLEAGVYLDVGIAEDEEDWNPGANEFEAYDCSVPDSPETVSLPEPDACDRFSRDNVVASRPATFHLLQQLPHRRIQVKSCRLERSKIPAYCGNADHQTILSGDVWMGRPTPVSVEDCKNMWSSGQAVVSKTPPGNSGKAQRHYFPISRHGRTQLTYESHGTSYWFDGNFWHGEQLSCQGSNYWSEGHQRWIAAIVQTVADDITLRELPAIVDKGGSVTLA